MTIKRISPLALAAAILFSLVLVSAAAAEDRVVASVGGIPITIFELQRKAQSLLPMQFHGQVPPEKQAEIREKALEDLITQAYKVRYALDEEIAVDNNAVDKVIEPILAKYETEEELRAAAGDEGLSAFRATVYRRLLAEKAEKIAVEDKIEVADEEVRSYYDENKETFLRPKRFKASHILIKIDPSSNKEERAALVKKAESLAKKAKAGEDFYNLAYYNSDDRSKYVGGDLGYFHEGQTAKPFEEAIKQMKPGDISDPVKTLYGYHIIKLDEVDEATQLGFEDVRDKIRKNLQSKEREKLYEAWMADLRNRYQVQRNGG